MDYLDGLNDKQKEAVLHDKGPLLILAGAGSGKTRVLTHRIAYLVNNRLVRPYNILAITFTNKAAKEMKERLNNLLEEYSSGIWINTFHSACLRILRREIEKIGYDKNFVIFDTADQKTLIKDCLKELDINEKNYPVKQAIYTISNAKDELIDCKRFEKIYQSDYKMSKFASIYTLYQKKLKQYNAVDFDDIIIKTIQLFNDNPDVLDYYQNKFQYVLVDEYQDTNTAQYSLISMLSKKYKNLCVVGDDDQSIYGWRGANIRNILDFEVEFKGCKTIKLEQNYRSTSVILEAANEIIKNNISRKSKVLWTDKD
ncbi:MAG: UvrD-helicase domain-containing protein, partial [Clostridiales bacterium]